MHIKLSVRTLQTLGRQLLPKQTSQQSKLAIIEVMIPCCPVATNDVMLITKGAINPPTNADNVINNYCS